MRLPGEIKNDLRQVDQILEVVEGKLSALAGTAQLSGLPEAVAIHLKRKRGSISHARRDLRETERIAAEASGGRG